MAKITSAARLAASRRSARSYENTQSGWPKKGAGHSLWHPLSSLTRSRIFRFGRAECLYRARRHALECLDEFRSAQQARVCDRLETAVARRHHRTKRLGRADSEDPVMGGPALRLAPVLLLAVLVGGFMVADKLWLHWYTPDTNRATRSADRTIAVPAATEAAQPAQSSTTQTVDAPPTLPAPTPGGYIPSAAEIRDAFAVLYLVGQRATYRVQYQTSSASGDKGDGYVVFSLPPLARVDTIPQGASEPSSQIVAKSDGTTIGCSSDSTGRNCAQIKPFAAPLPLAAGPIVFPASDTFGTLSVTETQGRDIAGTATRCFALAADTAGDAPTYYCFSSAGVPTYASGGFGVVEAIELSSDVATSEFAISTP